MNIDLPLDNVSTNSEWLNREMLKNMKLERENFLLKRKVEIYEKAHRGVAREWPESFAAKTCRAALKEAQELDK